MRGIGASALIALSLLSPVLADIYFLNDLNVSSAASTLQLNRSIDQPHARAPHTRLACELIIPAWHMKF